MSNYTIGIDLGTTYSCVGVWQGGQVHIIPNDQGNNTTPSYVAFKGDGRLIGDAAKKHASINPSNTIFDAKRLIGRRFDDEQIQRDIKQWPFKVIRDGNDNYPKIQVKIDENVKKEFYPEQISSMVLERMKEIAEAFLGEKVKDVVITVPAYFNDAQRQATKTAGAIAGLNILRIINEPTAAALAYGLEKNIEGERNVLVFDFGGGTLDVSVLSIKKGSSFVVKSTSGNNHLGGEDFDAKLVDHLCKEFKNKFDKDVIENPRALSKLRAAAVQAKQDLSSSTQASVIIDALMDGIDFITEVSRVEFEELCADIFTKAFEPVEKALEDAGIDKMSIDDVVLVGGSTRIPKIQSMLQNFFCGKKLNASMNPDEAVAYGAAVQAAMLSEEGKKSEILQAVRLTDVIPLSLGIETDTQRFMAVIIKKNTTIPCIHRQIFVTMFDNQSTVNIRIYEGERSMAVDNNFLGSFRLTGIPPAPARVTKIHVTFEVDSDGILHVTAEEGTSGNENGITIKNNEERWSKERTDYMIFVAEKYKSYDENQKNLIEAKHNLESYISIVNQAGHDHSSRLTKAEKKQINEIFSEALIWLKSNRLATARDFKKKLKEMEENCTEIMARKEKETALAKSQLNEYISSMKNNVFGNNGLSFHQNTRDQIMKICVSADKWIERNEKADKDDYVGVLEEIKRKCDSIISESQGKGKKMSWFSRLNPNRLFSKFRPRVSSASSIDDIDIIDSHIYDRV